MASRKDTSIPPGDSTKKPLNVYVVTEREHNGETYKRWREVGVAWKSADGETISVQIEPSICVSGGNIVIRPRKETDTAAKD